MAYPVRQFELETIFFVTSRTIQSRFLMAASDKTNELIGGILARAVRQCRVELFAYVFTSNRFSRDGPCAVTDCDEQVHAAASEQHRHQGRPARRLRPLLCATILG